MLKTLFNTFISLFVLLGVLLALTPSQAMEKEEETTSSVLLKRRQEKTKEVGVALTLFPEELTQHILLLTDPKDIPSIARVCKQWLRLTLYDKNFMKAFYETYNQNPELLKQLISSSPYVFQYVEEQLLPLCSHLPVSLGNWDTAKLALLPENIKDFATAVSAVSESPIFFKKIFINRDSLNFQKVAFASYMVHHTSKIQDQLKAAITTSNVDLNTFPELIKDVNNHPSLQRHLMTLKLLALSGDSDSQTQLKTFSTTILDPILFPPYNVENEVENENVSENKSESESESESEDDEIKEEHVYLIAEPFWSTFTNDKQAHKHEISMASKIMRSQFSKSLDAEKYNKFGDYVFAAFPSLLSTDDVVSLYEGIGKIYKAQGKYAEQLASIDKLYKIMDKKNLSNISDVSDLYMDIEKHEKALQILDEASYHVGEEPIRFVFQENMADCILNLQLKNRFSEVKDYLSSLLAQFPDDKNSIIVAYEATFGEGEYKETKRSEIELSKSNVYSLKTALHILEDQFEEAYNCVLKGSEAINVCIFRALKTQFQNLHLQKAKNLVQLLGDKMGKTLPKILEYMEKTPKEKSFFMNFLEPYKEVIGFLLLDRPDAHKKFEEMMVGFQSSITEKEDKTEEEYKD